MKNSKVFESYRGDRVFPSVAALAFDFPQSGHVTGRVGGWRN